MRARAALIASAAACALAVPVLLPIARAQRVEPRRAKTIVVGAPRGPAPTERVDGARTGDARTLLPTGTLHVAWRKSLGMPIDAAPLVDARGDIVVVAARGTVVVLAPDGVERWQSEVGSAAASPATLLSDGTAVFVTAAGDAVGVRLGNVRFRTHLGGERGDRTQVAPLALDDGGFVVATVSELVALDGEGNVRARASVDRGDPPTTPLVAGARYAQRDPAPTIYAVTSSGAVVAWVPAPGREAARIGSFGGAIDGGAAFVRSPPGADPSGSVQGGSLVAVVAASQIVMLDVAHGAATTRASASTVGAVALLGPPAVHAGVVTVLGLSTTRTLVLSFDASDPPAGSRPAAPRQAIVGPTMLSLPPDGGAGVGPIPPHVGVLVDARGDAAFAVARSGESGEVGVLSSSGAYDVTTGVCERFGSGAAANLPLRGGPAFAGLSPAGPSALVVACGSGVVVRVDSDFAPAP